MGTFRERVLAMVQSSPGLTDRELTDQLQEPGSGQQAVNQVARILAAAGRISRRYRADNKIGNYPEGTPDDSSVRVTPVAAISARVSGLMDLTEDDVKRGVKLWLEASGWEVDVKWGRDRGIDIEAKRGTERWIIEVKGCGTRNAMRVNYFLAVLGETLQRMDDQVARYSIALPDIEQFYRLWARLPPLAKSRTQISMILVTPNGGVREIS